MRVTRDRRFQKHLVVRIAQLGPPKPGWLNSLRDRTDRIDEPARIVFGGACSRKVLRTPEHRFVFKHYRHGNDHHMIAATACYKRSRR